MTEQLMELADRCEKATGPDRELDTGIAKTLGLTDQRTHMSPQGLGYVDRNQWAVARVEHYTASLDAAMQLVPEGFRVERLADTTPTIQPWQKGPWVAQLVTDDWPRPRLYGSSEHGTSAALALCAAALRARAQSENLWGWR